MKAARFHGKGDIRIEDIEKPEPTDGKVLIEIEWCGICGTDLHEYTMGPLACPRKDRPHPVTGETIPVTLGHEFAGRVVSETSGSSLKAGQKVMIDPRYTCQSWYVAPCCRSQISLYQVVDRSLTAPSATHVKVITTTSAFPGAS